MFSDFVKTYYQDGFVFPIDVVSSDNARDIRAYFELDETELANKPKRLSPLRFYPANLLPSFDKLIH